MFLCLDDQSVDHDIALVKLSKPAEDIYKNGSISPVCLPAKGESFKGGNFECVAAGWGITGQ